MGWAYLLPLGSSVFYVIAALFIKRASDLGVGVWRTAFVVNTITCLMFAPLWLLGGQVQPWHLWWQPAATALLFVSGQALTFLALNKGDVSIATPVMGLKLILVALFVRWFTNDVQEPTTWLAAALSTLAIILLNLAPGGNRRQTGFTAAIAAAAATAYALFDVLIQKWGPFWGPGRFLPIMLLFVLLLSFGFIPLFRQRLRDLPSLSWRWLLSGSFFMALQGLLLIFALARFGQATPINVVYSLRGVWSVLLVWTIGHWFANTEQHLNNRILLQRLLGALLMLVAVILLFL